MQTPNYPSTATIPPRDCADDIQQLLEFLPIGAILVRDHLLWMNKRAMEMTGYLRDELDSVEDLMARAIVGGQSLREDVTKGFLLAGNNPHPRMSSIVPIKRSDGSLLWIEQRAERSRLGELWLVSDVTGRIATEREYAQQIRLHNRVSRQADIGGWETDLVTGSSVWSDQVYRIYEMDPSVEVTEAVVMQLYTVAGRAQLEESVATCVGNGTPWDCEVSLVTMKGTHRWVRIIGELETEGDMPARIVGTLQDVTERHHIDEVLLEAHRKAEASSKAKSEFLANMSHEIRTPMNGVIGMTELLLETTLDTTQQDYAQTVVNSAKALLVVINDILDFSKVEAGKLELERIDMNLRDSIQDVARLLALQAHSKELELTVQINSNVPTWVCGDPGRLRQILLNLGGNAVKFTQHGEIAIEVSTLSLPEGDTKIRFDIRDTGIGIPASRLGALFQPFSQVDNSTTRRFGGSGLGLSIVRKLVDLMGGESGLESVEGVGSRFWFTASFGAATTGQLPSSLVYEALDELPVLVVDDNATNRKVLALQLAQCGCSATCAESADDAIRLMETAVDNGKPFEIVLVDHQMPGRDGADFGRQVVSTKRLSPARLILLTSSGKQGDGRQFAAAGFAGYLLKPIGQKELVDCLLMTAEADAAGWHCQKQPMITATTLTQVERERHRILVAEDNIVNQKVVRKILENMGLGVVVVNNGREAVAAWRTGSFDLILMDCQMPDMDGYQATVEIRRTENGAGRVPIIALTAHAMAGADLASKEAGMDDHMTKPIDRTRLREMLERYLK